MQRRWYPAVASIVAAFLVMACNDDLWRTDRTRVYKLHGYAPSAGPGDVGYRHDACSAEHLRVDCGIADRSAHHLANGGGHPIAEAVAHAQLVGKWMSGEREGPSYAGRQGEGHAEMSLEVPRVR